MTPFLDQIKATSAQIRKVANDNQLNAEGVAIAKQQEVDASALNTLLIVLAVLFIALFVILRRADGILVQQEGDREHGTVTVTSSLEGDRIRVDVTDAGTGVAPDELAHIFDNYYTPTKPASEGTGLGPPIARSIVREHGGEVTVVTEVGKGSTFTVFLPVSLAGPAQAVVPAAAAV